MLNSRNEIAKIEHSYIGKEKRNEIQKFIQFRTMKNVK